MECKCEDIKKIVEEVFDEKLAELKDIYSKSSKKKTKRKPSKYNIYIRDCVKDGNDFKSCAKKWTACGKKDCEYKKPKKET